jgi:hypothetical protein
VQHTISAGGILIIVGLVVAWFVIDLANAGLKIFIAKKRRGR